MRRSGFAAGSRGDFAGGDRGGDVVGDGVGEFEDAVELGGEGFEVFGAVDAEAEAVGEGLDVLVGGVGDLFLVGGVELGVGLALAGDEGEDEVGFAAGDGELGVGGERRGNQGEGFAEGADGLRGSGVRGYGEIEAEVGFAGDADLAADEPVDLGVEVDGAGFEGAGSGELDGEGDGVFVAEVHERAEREAAGDGKLHRARGDAVGEGPGDLGWFAGVAGVEPVDVPVLFEGEDEADLEGSAGGDAGGEGDEFSGEMLGLDGAGAAVADDL